MFSLSVPGGLDPDGTRLDEGRDPRPSVTPTFLPPITPEASESYWDLKPPPTSSKGVQGVFGVVSGRTSVNAT